MQKQLICLNLTDRIEPLKDERWTTRSIASLDQLSSLEHGDQAILCVVADDFIKLKSCLEQNQLMHANLPTIILINQQCARLISTLIAEGFFHVFSLESPVVLVKEFINNMFVHYNKFIQARPNKIAQKINPSRYTKKELMILDLFAKSPYYKIARHEVFNQVWGNKELPTNTLDVHICNLRKKLKEDNIQIETMANGHIQLIH